MGAERKPRVAPTYPIVVAEFQRSTRESVRVMLDEYEGDHSITVWTFWQFDPNEPARPSKTGITLGIQHLPKLFDGLARAMKEAQQRGLIGPDAPGTSS